MQHSRPDWLGTDHYPFDLSSISLGDGPVTYVDVGSGPVLLFVHAGMWSFVFRDAIERLRSDFRCITLDFPGYGLSPSGERELEVRDLARVLAEFVEQLDLRNVTLVAHDLGGPVGLAAAAHAPGRYSAMVLANTFAWTPDTPGLRAMLRIMSSRFVTALDAATNLVPRMTATRFGVGRHLDRADREAFLGPFRDPSVRRRFHGAMRSLVDDPEFTDTVEDTTSSALGGLPVLTVFGEHNDPFGFQPRHARTFEDHESVVVAGGNHFPMMDDPDLFARSIREWHRRKVEVPTSTR